MCLSMALTFRMIMVKYKYSNSLSSTSYLMTVLMLSLYVTIVDIPYRNVYNLNLDNGPRSNINMAMQRLYSTSYFMNIISRICYYFKDIRIRNLYDLDL